MNINTALVTFNLIRYVVGYVFITSGLMKLFSLELANYFLSLGLPYPDIMLNVVATLEIICGILLTVNRFVKNATIPLLFIIIGALLITKVPLLHAGFLHFAFNARLDITMFVLLIILFNQHSR
jgi:putative oxidoreductase